MDIDPENFSFSPPVNREIVFLTSKMFYCHPFQAERLLIKEKKANCAGSMPYA